EQLPTPQPDPAAEDRRHRTQWIAQQRPAERSPAAEDRSEQHARPSRVARQRVPNDERTGAMPDEYCLARQSGRDLYHVVHVRPQVRRPHGAAAAMSAQTHRVRRVTTLCGVFEPVLVEDPRSVAVPGNEEDWRAPLVVDG